jgi:hypothetical protein
MAARKKSRTGGYHALERVSSALRRIILMPGDTTGLIAQTQFWRMGSLQSRQVRPEGGIPRANLAFHAGFVDQPAAVIDRAAAQKAVAPALQSARLARFESFPVLHVSYVFESGCGVSGDGSSKVPELS